MKSRKYDKKTKPTKGVECRSYGFINVSSTWELTSVSMRYSQGDGAHTPLDWLVLYPRSVLYCVVVLCSLVLPTARSCAVWNDNNKDDVCTRTIPAGLKCPPPIYDHLIDHLV